jgi:hypothetical protein
MWDTIFIILIALVTILVIACVVMLGIIVATQITEEGLKSIIMPLWEGTK